MKHSDAVQWVREDVRTLNRKPKRNARTPSIIRHMPKPRWIELGIETVEYTAIDAYADMRRRISK